MLPAKCNAAMWHDCHQLYKPTALYEVDEYVILFQFLTFVRCLKYYFAAYICLLQSDWNLLQMCVEISS